MALGFEGIPPLTRREMILLVDMVLVFLLVREALKVDSAPWRI